MTDVTVNYRDILEDNRDSLVKILDVKQFFARLRSDSIFNLEDEQSITQNVRLSTNTEKAGAFLDKLATKGQMGFKVFLGMLETRYPELYKQLSGKDAVKVLQDPGVLSSIGETCQQHSNIIQHLAADNAEMASIIESYKKENLSAKISEIKRYNDILKSKHNKNMIKLQRFDSLQHALKMRQHELNDLTSQQRNILAKSLQLQQEKEAVQRRLRSSNVEITDLTRQLIEAKEHHKRKSIIQSSIRRTAIPRTSSLDSARSMELEIDRLRRELSAFRDSTDVDVEVAILRDDLRDKTAECEQLADEWQRTQKELNTAEEERITAISDLEDAQYACQNYEREASRYKQLYELNIKHSDRTEEDLKKAREDRNSLETHVDSLLREQRDLLYKLQDLQNRNINLSYEKSVLTKAIKNEERRKKGESTDLGYAGGSQSESSKEGSPRNSMEEYRSLISVEAPSSTIPNAVISTRPKERSKLHLDIKHDSIDNDCTEFRPRAKAISSPNVRSPFRFLEPANNYATLQRQQENIGQDKPDSMQNSSCSSIESNSDQDEASFDSNTTNNRPLGRQKKFENMSMEANPGSKKNIFTLACFGRPSFTIDDNLTDNKEVIEDDHPHENYDDDDEEDPYDYPEEYKRRSMSLNDIFLCNDYDFVEISKPKKK